MTRDSCLNCKHLIFLHPERAKDNLYTPQEIYCQENKIIATYSPMELYTISCSYFDKEDSNENPKLPRAEERNPD